jgi:hypothetical protein
MGVAVGEIECVRQLEEEEGERKQKRRRRVQGCRGNEQDGRFAAAAANVI